MTIIIVALAIVFAVSALMFLTPARKPAVVAVHINSDYAATSYHCHACNCRHTGECANQW